MASVYDGPSRLSSKIKTNTSIPFTSVSSKRSGAAEGQEEVQG